MVGTTDIEVLRLVFAFHIVDRIVYADDEVDPMEIAWVRERFPRDTLATHGLIDDEDRLTDHYRDLLAESLMRLPSELDREAKLDLIHDFFGTALADGHFEAREGDVIVVAARLLGLPLDDVHAVLDADERMGTVDLDDPEDAR